MDYTLAEIANKIGATVVYAKNQTPDNCMINSLATLSNAQSGQIAFLANAKYRQQLKETKASAVILAEDCLDDCQTNALVMKNPYLGYALVAQLLDNTPKPARQIHSSAVIDPSVTLGKDVCIGANTVLRRMLNWQTGLS